jgi:hypothetical protein
VAFGTDFQNSAGARPGIRWQLDVGALRVGATWQKESENSQYQQPFLFAQEDKEGDIYSIRANFDQKRGLDVGAQLVYLRNSSNRVANTAVAGSGGYLISAYAFEPYIIAKFGPVNLSGEVFYVVGGDARKYDSQAAACGTAAQTAATACDRKAEGQGFYVEGKVNMGPAYVGASYIYQSGDDVTTFDKQEGSMAKQFGGGTSLRGDGMFFSGSDYYTKMVGTYKIPNSVSAANLAGDNLDLGDNTLANAKHVRLYGGMAFSKALSAEASFYLLKVDKAPAGYVSDEIGKEFAATAKYKIFDNLAVQLDFAYLWTGDYFKGTNAANLIANNYFVTSWLVLDF